jgi:hypothetical protein
VLRSVPGRERGRRCRTPNKHNKSGKRCTRLISVGSFHVDAAGVNRFRFTGRIQRHTLRAAPYQLRAIPRNATGDLGPPVVRSFRVIP